MHNRAVKVPLPKQLCMCSMSHHLTTCATLLHRCRRYVQCVTQNSGVNAKDKRLQEQAEKAKKVRALWHMSRSGCCSPPVCEQAHTPPQAINWVPRRLSLSVTPCLQEKKEAEERRKQELNELFAMAIKQPKVPAGEQLYVQCRAEVGPGGTGTPPGSRHSRAVDCGAPSL